MIGIATNIARRFAPHLVRRIAGDRAGEIAQQVFDLAGGVVGSTDPAEIERRLEQDTELAHEFRLQAAELDAEIEQAYLADRQDARDMRLKLAELGKTDWMMYLVGGVVVVGFVAVIVSVLFKPDITQEQKDILLWLGGTLSAGFMAIVGYFFGSSRGSAEKTRLMSGGPTNGRR